MDVPEEKRVSVEFSLDDFETSASLLDPSVIHQAAAAAALQSGGAPAAAPATGPATASLAADVDDDIFGDFDIASSSGGGERRAAYFVNRVHCPPP